MHKKQQHKGDLVAFLMLWSYLILQAMDFCTTIIGTSLGIKETNELLLELATIIGDLPALLLAKAMCIVPALMALRAQKTWALFLVFMILDVYYLDIVSGNIMAIYEALKT